MPPSTLSNLQSALKSLGIVTETATGGYAVTDWGRQIVSSVNRLAQDIEHISISRPLKKAREGGASEEALMAYETALKEKLPRPKDA